MEQGDALIREAYGIDPDEMDNEHWCKLYAETLFLNKLKHLNMKAAILAAMAEIFGDGSTHNTMDS